VLGQAGAGDDTLLRAVHADTERPSVVVLVQHSNELTSVQTELILHRGLEVKLNTVDIVGTRSRAVGLTADHGASNRRRTGRSWAR
jgi:alpha-D-ribose 1-methylphosphonate 5-triphosphate synthase subunit PhnL